MKANVLFLDRKPGAKEPWTKTVWVYDLRTNKHFTLRTKLLTRGDLDEFVDCYLAGDRHKRVATWSKHSPEGRWRPFTYEEIITRDKVSLDIFWLRDGGLCQPPGRPHPRRKSQSTCAPHWNRSKISWATSTNAPAKPAHHSNSRTGNSVY